MPEQQNPQDDGASAAAQQGAHAMREEWDKVGAAVRELSRDADELARGWLEANPYATLAVAAGVGYVLGGGLPHIVVRRALGLGSRMAIDMMLARAMTRGGSGPAGE